MINKLHIRNFKSIADLALDCKRVNIFIGKPNAGKSNILESVGLLSLPYAHYHLKSLVRLENMTNLFRDLDVSRKIQIRVDDTLCQITFEHGRFQIVAKQVASNDLAYDVSFDYGANQLGGTSTGGHRFWESLKFYKFLEKEMFPVQETTFLSPPGGDNLLAMILVNAELKSAVTDLLAEFGYKILFKPQESKIEIAKEVKDILVSYPYTLTSDTLQRVIFYEAAILTNKDSTLIFEEPESHAFPYYTKFLAERIALDRTNQYILSTHNPYFLMSLIEKTPKEDIAVFVTYLKDYETQVERLSNKQLSEALELGANIFFNMDRYIDA